MQRNILSITVMLGLLLMLAITGCVKPFDPPATRVNYGYLVVDGTITLNAPTHFRLSHTRTLYDTSSASPENGAVVSLENESGMVYPLVADGQGQYTDMNASLSGGQKYRLNIQTENGRQYRSDFVEPKPAPEIDSLEWDQDDDIFIYVNTHDPQNQSRYYRWEFTETFAVHSAFESHLDFVNGEVVFLEPEQYKSVCYHTENSTSTIVANSIALKDDVIKHKLLTTVPNDNSKISDRYSILVRQFVLNQAAYQYWETVRQNSQQAGGIFDPQPSQLKGNIRCLEDTLEPVIGFVTAGTVTEKRMFIKNNELKDRREPTSSAFCKETLIARSDAAEYLSDGQYLPAYYVTNGPLAIAPKLCVDCTLSGGVTQVPSFW